MHVGAVLIFEGPPPTYDDFLEHVREPAAPRAAVPPEARLPAGSDRAAVLGRRPQLQPLLPRAPFGPARAGIRGAAPEHRRAGLLAAARPHEAALGDVAGPGTREEPLRPDHQDPPRAGRRRLRRGHRDGPLRREAGPGEGRGRVGLGSQAPPSSRRARSDGRQGRGRGSVPPRPPGCPRRDSPAHDREEGRGRGRGARRGRLELHQPGAGGAAERRDRLAPSLRLVALEPRGLQADQVLRSAAPSTTSSSTVVSGALRSWLQGRGIRTEGLELRALVPVSIRAEDEHGQLGNRIAAMRGPLPVYVEDPVKRLGVVRVAMDDLKELEAGARRRGDLALQRLRAADPARPGGADQLLHPALQPDRDQRPRAADPALRAGPRAPGRLPGRLPARASRARDRDHELQRRASASACSATTTRWRTSSRRRRANTSLAELVDAAAAVQRRTQADQAAGADIPG